MWDNLCEEYYILVNKNSYNDLLNDIKKRELIRNKLTGCYACSMLMKINCAGDEVKEALKHFGFDSNISSEELERRLIREYSYLRLLDKKAADYLEQNNTNESVNFWRMVSQYEDAVGRQIDVKKVSVYRWIEMTKILKENVRNKQRRNSITRGA